MMGRHKGAKSVPINLLPESEQTFIIQDNGTQEQETKNKESFVENW